MSMCIKGSFGFLLVALILECANAHTCPLPFSLVGNKCYHVSLQETNWHVADRSCRKLGAELMVLDNQEDKLLTTNFLKSMGLSFTQSWHHSVWAGINCLGNRRTFLLARNGETVPYLNWVPREPEQRFSRRGLCWIRQLQWSLWVPRYRVQGSVSICVPEDTSGGIPLP
ncbi:GM18792 [Drosophila sechellia]|uniref:GM18792 n=1 Tax=Drosophila sechellia TaxID=7238 RepID=B4HWZ4_DROSE|nr:GM18792 [Drosophila sechellia]